MACVATTMFRVYARAAQDPFTVTVARALRLPALKVNGIVATYGDFSDDLKAITKMRAFDQGSGGPGATLTDEQMTDQVLFRLINNALVKKTANEMGITVTNDDIEKLKQEVLFSQFASPAEAEKALLDRYGWNLKTYERKVMRPFVLQKKLAEKISTNEVERGKIKARAQEVLDQIKGGADFAALAKQYGEDGTAAGGGDLGWFAKGDMVPEFETAAFALKKGELSPVLVETPYGYHVIRVTDRKTEKVKGADGKTTNQEQVQASHILFLYPSLEKFLNDEVKKAKIQLYIKVHNPFPALQQGTATT